MKRIVNTKIVDERFVKWRMLRLIGTESIGVTVAFEEWEYHARRDATASRIRAARHQLRLLTKHH